MDALTGALVAAAVAWLSILFVVVVPGRGLPSRPLRILGGVTLAILALIILGVPLPSVAPVLFFSGGVLGVWLTKPRGAAAA